MITAAAFVLLGLFLTATLAYWADGGNRVSFSEYDERQPKIVDSGDGHAIIAYIDEIYSVEFGYTADLVMVQRVDRRGDRRWDPDGVMCNSPGDKNSYYIEAVTDGDGGAIVAWTIDQTHSNTDIYIQRVDRDGNILWTSGGIPVAISAYEEKDIALCEDGAGGAFIVWRDDRTGTYELYLQAFTNNGYSRFPSTGMAVSTTSSYQYQPRLALAGTGTVIIMWKDYRSGNEDLYAQAIDTTGTRIWGTDEAVCTEPSNQTDHNIAGDGAGGAIAVWRDYRNGKSDIFAQRLLLSGGAYWVADGYDVCTHSFAKLGPLGVARDDAGGAYFTWSDYRSDIDLYAQRLGMGGKKYWPVDGIPVCAVNGHVGEITLLPDGAGGVFVTWIDRRTGEQDIYAQRLDGRGNALWTADGEFICGGAGQQKRHLVSANEGTRGVFTAWANDYDDSDIDIYACYYDLDGDPGMPEPRIMDAGDLPGDEGGWIRLRVKASTYDDQYAYYDNTTGYNVWRRIDPPASSVAGDAGMPVLSGSIDIQSLHEIITDPERSAGLRLSAAQAAAFELPPGEWESLGSHNAMTLAEYSLTVPTRTDSTESGPATEYYVVTAHTTDPLKVFVSEIVQGYSVDNLVPAAPLGLAGEQSYSPEGLQLTWNDNNESDLTGYRVYRGASDDFTPSQSNLVGAPSESELFDGDWSWEAGYWYKIAAVDRHGNESPLAVFGPDLVTGDDPMPLPDATFLAQNFPNPFNPITNIGFGIKEQAYVSLRIYDAAGKLISVLINESRPAGNYTAEWNGRDNNGSTVASGVYFYRLTTKEFKETKKMILLR
jgi:hypothetical protein